MSPTIVYLRSAHGRGPVHAVVPGSRESVCGAHPPAWGSEPHDRPDCTVCRRKLGMGPIAPPRAEGGAR